MFSDFLKLIIDLWGSFKSIPFAFFLLVSAYLSAIFKTSPDGSFLLSNDWRIWLAVAALVFFLCYVIFCVIHNRLEEAIARYGVTYKGGLAKYPKEKSGEIGSTFLLIHFISKCV